MIMNYLYSERQPMMIVNEEVMELGEILRVKRVSDQMTLSELAQKLNMSPGILSEIERGIRQIPPNKEHLIDKYVYKTLYLNGGLEFVMDDDEDDDGGFEYIFGFDNNDDEDGELYGLPK